jgi:hypothetical protein
MLCLKENCQYFSGVVRRFLGITIWSSEKSALCYFNHLGLFKRRKWPFAVEDEFKGRGGDRESGQWPVKAIVILSAAKNLMFSKD